MRIITRSKYLEHTNPIFEKLDLLKMSEINKYIIGKFMYRWYHNQLPSIFHNMFVSVTDIHNYNTRQKDHLYTTKIKTCLGQTRITYLGPKIWNDILKAKINPNISEYVFSKSLKKMYKGKYSLTEIVSNLLKSKHDIKNFTYNPITSRRKIDSSSTSKQHFLFYFFHNFHAFFSFLNNLVKFVAQFRHL